MHAVSTAVFYHGDSIDVKTNHNEVILYAPKSCMGPCHCMHACIINHFFMYVSKHFGQDFIKHDTGL